jgi:hypothetical protein
VTVVALLLLAPWTAECSWGGFTAADFPFVVLFLAPLYGGAAVLIREVARRTGRGWPAIVLLAAAFGVVQAGLVDQSLFNPHYLDDTEFAGEAVAATGPWPRAVDFVGNHILLSICAPIALVESFAAPHRRDRPWLGRRGLAAIAVLYLLGSVFIFFDSRKGFLASPFQLAGAAAVAGGLIAAAMRRWPSPAQRPAPRPIWVGLVVLGAGLMGWFVDGWPGVGVRLALAAALVVRWSRRTGWRQEHVLAGWAAPLVVAAAGAYFVPNYQPASPAAALTGDIAISVITLALVAGACWRLARATRPVPGC